MHAVSFSCDVVPPVVAVGVRCFFTRRVFEMEGGHLSSSISQGSDLLPEEQQGKYEFSQNASFRNTASPTSQVRDGPIFVGNGGLLSEAHHL